MGTMLGNFLGLILVAIAAGFGFASFEASAIAFTALAYLAWVLVISGHYIMRPPKDAPICQMFNASEVKAYRTYHSYLMFPGGAEAYSAALNLLRIAGFVWGGLCLWKGYYWLGAADIAYFFVSGNMILTLNPVLYMGRAALTGNDVAARDMSLLESIQSKRNIYNSAEDEAET